VKDIASYSAVALGRFSRRAETRHKVEDRAGRSSRGRVLGGRWISVRLSNGLPRRDPTNSSAHLVSILSRDDFDDHRFAIGPSGLIHVG
jgi:hypothetical protein